MIYRLAFLVCILFSSTCSLAKQTIVYSGEKTYVFELLKYALQSSNNGDAYELEFSPQKMKKQRAMLELSNKQNIDVISTATTVESETDFLAVRIPIYKGILGWRIPLINRANPNLFENINTLQEFKTLSLGLASHWPEVEIFKHNDIKVVESSNYPGLYSMLHQQRFDYFPRTVMRIQKDYESYKHLNLHIDEYTLLYYPYAFYFFVHKENHSLANDIKEGLEVAIRDGTFDAMFMEYYGTIVRKIKSENRKGFELANPKLPIQTPLKRKELWINLANDG
jgi:hypothetical protein